ncbi:XdhC family aldehyde oxidoreductase maturation factor [Desulfofustis glycolicus]|uniref:Xanthine dehydrogenase accessory factor n=1 Tax=Desulfofustis glycolicus DSM 9705 TaxID=1121409 RepID=A0A1M5ULR8_9BACT|nr:XdhC/CoxI family protein [Desulfofustis glycolicus]SHH63944.1 xanthine dehydrogenase accessory factor [Desulfofustis glycolicus DSM 9705]
MRIILDHLVETLGQGETAVIGGIVRSSGSAPRTSGAWLIAGQVGLVAGSVGGGAVEGACLKKAMQLLQGRESSVMLRFSLTDQSPAESGMLCGGNIEVILARVEPEQTPFFRRLQQGYRRKTHPLLLIFLPQEGYPARFGVVDDDADDNIPATLRQQVLQNVKRTPFLVSHDGGEVFVEPLVHPGTVHLVGGGHVALATAQLAAFVGFAVKVMDDRSEFADPDRFPQADEVRVVPGYKQCFGEQMGAADYLIAATRGHHFDREVLAQALRTQAGYIGMIGSRRKRQAIYALLQEEGFRPADLDRVHCPIGLTIGAQTPQEIAVSIVAELVQVRADTMS